MEKMEKAVIQAELRTTTGKKVGALRREGKLPGVIYGYKVDPTPILMDLRVASRILATQTSSSLITVEVDGKQHATIVREKQRDFIRGTLRHIDFQVVSLTEKLRANVGITLQGTSPAVEELNGVLVTRLSELSVEALPDDLPDQIVIDLEGLTEIGSAIYVKDIPIPDSVTVLSNPEEVVAIVTAVAVEEVEEEEPVEETEEPEVIEKGKREEEEGEVEEEE